MNSIQWAYEPSLDGRHQVIGYHSDGKQREVYQFATREWALVCKRSMERLSPISRCYITAVDTSAMWSGSTFVATPELMLKIMMDQLTPAKLLAMWTAPLSAKAKVAFRKLMWGEQA